MSANRDKSQKIGFVYSNLYQMYGSHRTAEAQRGRVLKAADVASQVFAVNRAGSQTAVKVNPYSPVEILQTSRAPVQIQNPAIDGLKKNLQALNELHERLKFMLQELEELVKE